MLLMASTVNLAFASDTESEEDQVFELVIFDDGSIQPRINADGTFSFSFTSRLHSDHFTATSDTISLSFITSTDSKAYYIALYDVTDDPIDPTLKSMTQSKDDTKADSKTFNVTKGRKYCLTFSKLNPRNADMIKGVGTIYGIR